MYTDLEAVISCPGCRRQYCIASDLNGRLVRCYFCMSYFTVVIAVPGGLGDAILLDKPLCFRTDFIYESTSCVASKARALFWLAGESFTQSTLARFVANLPRSIDEATAEKWASGYCVEVMRKARDRCGDGVDGGRRYEELVDYFIDHIPGRHGEALDTVINAFIGVLSVPFDSPPASEAIPDPKPEPAVPLARPRLGRLWRALIFLRLAKAPC